MAEEPRKSHRNKKQHYHKGSKVAVNVVDMVDNVNISVRK